MKFWYIVVSCWIFLYELYYDARIHERQTIIKSKELETNVLSTAESFTSNWPIKFDFFPKQIRAPSCIYVTDLTPVIPDQINPAVAAGHCASRSPTNITI